jgi:ankyrin repeat protein
VGGSGYLAQRLTRVIGWTGNPLAVGFLEQALAKRGEDPWLAGDIRDTLTWFDGKTPLGLHGAAGQGGLARVNQLLAEGADANAADEQRRTPLHAAAEGGHRAVVEALLAAGADANATDLQGRTPTGLAVQGGHTEVADLLREHGGVE